ncbi:MAG: hypothetical protein M3174_07830 [Actinomycetota bacterium]|nr:hypothetical protein [Actinomycetota bacterium]
MQEAYGGPGSFDNVRGGSGRDNQYGGAGNDLLLGASDPGLDYLDGEDGIDDCLPGTGDIEYQCEKPPPE